MAIFFCPAAGFSDFLQGAGGWGKIGSTPSDNYINSWEAGFVLPAALGLATRDSRLATRALVQIRKRGG